ncbi:MAG: hypothetical protein LUG16_03735, partial [Candidatus Gastranaerophilales bacterium]|nr:hypothetical protein [Candidatus Gastranaerophilales bacterium]
MFNNLIAEIKRRGLTQKEFAKRVKINEVVLSRKLNSEIFIIRGFDVIDYDLKEVLKEKIGSRINNGKCCFCGNELKSNEYCNCNNALKINRYFKKANKKWEEIANLKTIYGDDLKGVSYK